ncbi:hypothetical protein ACVWZ8_004411 [Arthrobacter sp. UYCu723]
MIMIRMRKTRAWPWPMALRIGGALRAHLLEGEADQDGGQECRQHRNVARNDAQQEVDGAVSGRLLVWVVRRQVQAFSRVDQVAYHQSDGQREGGHDDEVAQGQPAHLAHRGGLGDRADTQHDGAEDDRSDHHLDQLDEAVAQRLQRFADLGEQQPHEGTQDHGHDDRDVQVVGLVEPLALLDRRRGRCR